MAILTAGKTDSKSETVTRHKEGHYVMMKGSIRQEDRTIIINIYRLDIRALKHMKQAFFKLKEETDSNTVTDVITPFSVRGRTSGQKIKGKTGDSNNATN